MKKLITLLVSAIVIASLFCGCVEIADVSVNTSQDASAGDSVTNAVYGMGETGSDGIWNITLTGAKIYDKVGDGYLVSTPTDGKQFLVMFFEVENISDTDDYFNYYDITSYIDDYSASITIILGDVEDYKTLTGDVAAGKKLRGYLAWEVSPDWQSLEMSYCSNLFSKDNKVTFAITPADLTK